MEHITNCPKCGSEIKRVPSGVSKRTGKPYNAFYSCSSRECDYTARLTDKPQEAPKERPTDLQMIFDQLQTLDKGLREVWTLLGAIQNRIEDIYNNLDRK